MKGVYVFIERAGYILEGGGGDIERAWYILEGGGGGGILKGPGIFWKEEGGGILIVDY